MTEPPWACDHPARYLAKVDWDNGLMQLCECHARTERACGAVVWIRSLRAMDVNLPPRAVTGQASKVYYRGAAASCTAGP